MTTQTGNSKRARDARAAETIKGMLSDIELERRMFRTALCRMVRHAVISPIFLVEHEEAFEIWLQCGGCRGRCGTVYFSIECEKRHKALKIERGFSVVISREEIAAKVVGARLDWMHHQDNLVRYLMQRLRDKISDDVPPETMREIRRVVVGVIHDAA
jgi:hypothetical protein